MEERRTEELLDNLDRRMTRVEQILPALATREELQSAIQSAIAPLATREELQSAIQSAIAPLATREEMLEEGERTRRYTKVLIESLRDEIRLLAEGYAALDARESRHHSEVVERLEHLETLEPRVAALEARYRKRPN